MTKTFTPDDIVRFHYGETTGLENRNIRKQLAVDSQLESYSQSLKAAQKAMQPVLFEPSEAAVDRILAYARAKSPRFGRN